MYKRNNWKNLIYRYNGEEGGGIGGGKGVSTVPEPKEPEPKLEDGNLDLDIDIDPKELEINKRFEELEKKLKASEEARKKSEKELAIQKSNLVKKNRETMTEAEKLAEREKEIAEKEKQLALRLSKGVAIEGLTKAGFSESDYADILDYLIDPDETVTATRINGITALLLTDREKTIKETKKEIFKNSPNLQGAGKGKDKDPIKDGFTRGVKSVINSQSFFK